MQGNFAVNHLKRKKKALKIGIALFQGNVEAVNILTGKIP